MPDCEAMYGGLKFVGRNAAERPQGDKAMPSVNIHSYAKALADVMDKLTEEARNSYACAEAQALAKLLGHFKENTDFAKITFTGAKSDGGRLLWQPCGNCASWLQQGGGWGPDAQYKLKDSIVASLSPQKSKGFKLQKDDFPAL